jgi:hypothetical protein
MKYFRAWLSSAIQPMIAYRERESKSKKTVPDEFKLKLEWVFGIRSSDTKKAI